MPILRPFRLTRIARQLVREHRDRDRTMTAAEMASAYDHAIAAGSVRQQAARDRFGIHAFVRRGPDYVKDAKARGIPYMQADENDFRRCAVCSGHDGESIHGGENGKDLPRDAWVCRVCQLDADRCEHNTNPWRALQQFETVGRRRAGP